jgi:hypothetical protein
MEAPMKKYLLAAGMTGLITVLFSCASAPKEAGPIDRGQFPLGAVFSESAILYIQGNVSVLVIDDSDVPWKNENLREQFVNIEPGLRVFTASYNDGKLVSSSRVTLAAQLEGGGVYLLKAAAVKKAVSFTIVRYEDGREGEEVNIYLKHG